MSRFVAQVVIVSGAFALLLLAIGVAVEVRRLFTFAREIAIPLAVGTPVPLFSAKELRSGRDAGQQIATETGRQWFLFVSPGCPACRSLAKTLASLGDKANALGSLTIFCSGTRARCEVFAAGVPPFIPIVLDERIEIRDVFRIRSVPTLVLIEGQVVRGYRRALATDDVFTMISSPQVQVS